jgi:DNA repair exonuclease SbcCD ATPase subunit
MFFQTVVLKNFLSYADQSFDLDETGLTLIEGKNLDEGDSNGAGKSSIWDGISWALFGSTVRGLKNDDVINRKIKQDCSVSVSLSVKSPIKVTRHRKHREFGDRLWIETDKKKIELGTVAQTQEWLLDFLGIDFELFRCTVLFAQGETFNFVNAGNKAQKEILSKVMKVNYADFLSKAKEKSTDLLVEKEDLDRKVSVLNSHLVEDPSQLYKKEIEEWDGKANERISQLAKEITDLKAHRTEVEALCKPIDSLEAMRAKLKALIDANRIEADEARTLLAKQEADISHWRRQITSFQGMSLAPLCTLCKQPFKDGHVAGHLAEAEKGIKSAGVQADKHRASITGLRAKQSEIMAKVDKVSEAISTQRQNSILLGTITEGLTKMAERLVSERKEKNPFIERKEAEIKRQGQIKEKIEEIAVKRQEIEDSLPYYGFWVNAFGDNGIKSFVFDLICSTLTNKTNAYLNVLSGGSVLVSFDTQKRLKSGETREKFECLVHHNGDVVPYDAFSGGEKRRISLAVDMALSDLMSDYSGAKFSLVVFDEQDQFLDNSGRKNYLKLLQNLSKHKHVFVVAHDDQFKSSFDNIWTIQKKGGVSCLDS